jgi:hypothetical protein
MLSYQLINGTRGGLNYTWSSIALDREFADGEMPMPILVADGRNPGEKIIGPNATVFEINPFEHLTQLFLALSRLSSSGQPSGLGSFQETNRAFVALIMLATSWGHRRPSSISSL